MVNRPLYVRKYHSGRLKEFGYNINCTFDESKELKEIIGLSDSQILRTIRNVNHRVIDKNEVEYLINLRDFYKRQLTYQQLHRDNKNISKLINKLRNISKKNINNNIVKKLKNKYLNPSVYVDEVKRIQDKLNRMLFIEDYIVVVMDNLKQYEYLYHNGFTINGKLYKRLSCSAGQARVSTVVFCNNEIKNKVIERLENGRDKTKKFSPSKYNAYFGLSGSATKLVSEPKFIVVKDYENTTSFMANFVTEKDWSIDDEISVKEIRDTPMNRTDGMGLISPRQAAIWAKELDLDYVPSQFCIRQSFIKGMLCVFDIHQFCEEVNGGNYIVDTIYTDEDGNYIKADLRDYDVILSESQFKLWDSFKSIDQYIDNCHKNNLLWGVALVSPKEAKHMLKLNYQFIQTLNLTQNDIEKLASQFVEWVNGVSYDNVYYMLLFLLGVNNDENKIKGFLSGSDSYWIKSLVLNHNLKNDKYIRTKIRELIKKKIENACKGDIYVDGNFQVIVSDPYGFMQHVCGQEVTGLLKKDEFYSNYWNERNVTKVDAMRSPLTYLSEHVILNLRNDDEVNKWYKHCKLGIILNYHGHETFNFAGSDFDMDILATTSNEIMINGVYKDELPVVYEAPKPEKIIFTEDDLYLSDTFSFGSIIGSITNKGSNGYALLPIIEEKYGKDSKQYKLLKSRLQQCCKAQSAQIDKAKIGRAVKGIPDIWINRNKIEKDNDGNIIDPNYEEKLFYNELLLNRYPYFFRYVYKDTNKEYKKYLDEYNVTCKQKFKMSLNELESLQRKTEEQKKFIESFYEFCPVVISNSSMNMLCKYIESINFNVSQHTKIKTEEDVYKLYKSSASYNKKEYVAIVDEYQKFINNKRFEVVNNDGSGNDENEYDENLEMGLKNDSDDLYFKLSRINSNPYVVLNCLVDYLYNEKKNSNKDILWITYGKYIYNNVLRNSNVTTVMFPFPTKENEKADIEYLGYKYTLHEVKILWNIVNIMN